MCAALSYEKWENCDDNSDDEIVACQPCGGEDARSLIERAAPISVRQDNPKKGESAKRFRKYMAATNAAEFIQLGGTRADLKYDIARGWGTVTDRAPPPAREKKAKQERGELVFEQNIPKLRCARGVPSCRVTPSTCVHLTMTWVVFFSMSGPVGPL